GATTAKTTPSMSFALRRGVCQDFAHIMIDGLRGIGLPAAYVSGYLRTVKPAATDAVAVPATVAAAGTVAATGAPAPAPGPADLQGSDAMHAWVLVWCGEAAGWQGLDPTNAILARDDHVVVAVGRDYADVAPVDGVVLVSGGQKLDVSVSV